MNETAIPAQHELRIDPERVAYWYFRLNGFLQIENFVVHPKLYGGQRTDADLICVRFPYRAERLIDDPTDLMEDDEKALQLSQDRIDIVIAEIKTGRCALNGPWTNEENQNIHRVLAAIGFLEPDTIPAAADALYADALFDDQRFPRVRLVLVGNEADTEIASQYSRITQITWHEVLSFIWNRFNLYRRQKAQVDQWDDTGQQLKRLARQNEASFIIETRKLMGVRAVVTGASA